jgi:hypothetical protein
VLQLRDLIFVKILLSCKKIVMYRLLGTSLLLFLLSISANAQHIYHHITNKGIYEFIDEVANAGIVEVNSSIKPYSRKQISTILSQTHDRRSELNPRQQAELDFYLKDFGKELHSDKNFPRRFDVLYYRDTLFAATLNPVMGVHTLMNDGEVIYRRWVGAEAWGYIGDNFAMYASLRDYNENQRLGVRTYLNQYQGGGYKISGTGGEFSEMRGGVSWGWSWGNISMVKEHLEWGSGYNGTNILYSRAPSFAMLKLQIKPAHWFELNYIHGWLVSQIIDSTRTYTYAGAQRNLFHPKYIAANFFTFTPVERLNISLGNSIVYSDMDVHPVYLTPLFFYKSVDHHLNGMSNYTGQNAQMFFDVSSRLLKNTHLYATLFLDEIGLMRMFDPEKHSNFFSLKAGTRISNFPIQNLTLTLEYTRNNPQTFEHIIATTNFESNRYNLGHYLRENAKELFLSASYSPFKNGRINLSYTHAQKGPSTNEEDSRWGLKFLETIDWEMRKISSTFSIQVLHDSYIYFGVDYASYEGNVQLYTPSVLLNNKLTITFGGNYGF